MKKLLIFASALCFVFASCSNNTTETNTPAEPEEMQEMNCPKDKGPKCQMTEEEKAECEAFRQKWNDWANLDDAAKKELITTAKAKVDERRTEMKNQLAEAQAQMEAQETAWADFDNKTLDEQKEMLDNAMKCDKHHGPKPCCKDEKKPCCKDGEKPCCKKGPKPEEK